MVGFAAETENLETYARDKLARKGCDWIVANNVAPETGVLGGDMNTVHLVSGDGEETWEKMSKTDIAARLTARIGAALQTEKQVPANEQITAQLMQLPHGQDLPLPSYETAEAAGMDLRAAARRAADIEAGRA